MYRDVLDEHMQALYDEASEALILVPEIKLMRAYAMRACEEKDLKTVLTMVDAVMKLVRLQFQNVGDESPLSELIERVADDMRADLARESLPSPVRLVPVREIRLDGDAPGRLVEE